MPVTLDHETLNTISARLYDRAEEIQQVTLHGLNEDLRLAAQACIKLADTRQRIAEIVQNLLDHPEWDRAAFVRDLRELMDEERKRP
jgi:hypothetical protein